MFVLRWCCIQKEVDIIQFDKRTEFITHLFVMRIYKHVINVLAIYMSNKPHISVT